MFSVSRACLCLALVAVLGCAVARAADAPANQWEWAITAYEKADKDALPPADAIEFTGSSTIAIWNNKIPQDMAPFTVFGRGFGGSQISDLVYYANRIILPYKPRAVVIYSGSNDVSSGKSPAQVADDFKAVVRLVHAALPKTYVVFVSQQVAPSREAYRAQLEELNALIHEYANSEPLVRYFEIRPILQGMSGQSRKELFSADMLHLNGTGYQLLSGALKPWLLDLLYDTNSPSPQQQAVNRYTTRIRFADPLTCGKRTMLALPITNDTAFPLIFAGSWDIPGEKSLSPRSIAPLTIAPGQSVTISFRAKISESCVAQPVLAWTISSGDARVHGAAIVRLKK